MADPWGYTAETAPPRLRGLYERLAPDPNADYGVTGLAPLARDKTTGAVRFAMPMAIRDLLTGSLDLMAGLDTGELTPRAATTITMGGLGAGGSLAPRGALAAGAARPRLSPSPLDQASRFGHAREIGFRPNLNLYHWTDAPDFPAFAYGDGRSKSLGLPQYGFWAAEDPRYLEDVARLWGRPDGTGSRVIPLVPRFSKLGQIDLEPGVTHQDIALNIPMLWGDGYDALRFSNYNTFANGTPTPTWLFRDPNQLRSRFAKFDPARSDSSDLLAGFAVPGPAPGFNMQSQPDRTPGFNVQPQPEPAPGLAMPAPVPVRRFRPPSKPVYGLAPDGGA